MKNKKKHPLSADQTITTTATAQQLATIKSLQSNIGDLANQLNRPYATATSIIIFPLIVELLFLHEMSPFHQLYNQLNQYYYEKFLKEWEPFGKLINERMETTAKGRDHVVKHLLQLQYLDEFNIKKNPSLTFDEILDQVDELDRLKTAKWIPPLTKLKQTMISVYNNAIIEFALHTKKEVLDVNKPHQFSFKPLYNMMEKELSYYKKAIPEIYDNAIAMDQKEKIAAEMDKWMMFSKVFLITLGQNLVVNPLFMKFFPNGVGQPKIPIAATHNWFSENKATEVILLLEAHQEYLSTKAKRNIKVSRYLSTLIMPLAIYLLASNESPSPELIIFALSLVGTALTNIKIELEEAYAHYNFQNSLKKQLQKIKLLLNDFIDEKDIKIIDAGNLKASYINVYFSGSSTFSKIVKNCLVHHKVRIISHSAKSIMISADASLSLATVNVIKDMCKETQTRITSIKKMKKQILEFYTIFSDQELADIMPSFDRKMLPSCTIKFNLPLQFQDLFNNVINLFKKNTVRIIPEENNLQFTMVGHEAAEDIEFEKFKDIVKTDKNRQQSEKLGRQTQLTFFSEQSDISQRKGKKLIDLKDDGIDNKSARQAILPVASNTPPVRKIARWRQAGIYDSFLTHCNINPFDSSQIHDQKSIKRSNVFTKNELDPQAFPDPTVYKALSDIINVNPHLVPRKGKSGLVYAAGKETDHQGRWFSVSMKAKLIGHKNGKGDVRAYAEAETNEAGETVHVFKGVQFHSHK